MNVKQAKLIEEVTRLATAQAIEIYEQTRGTETQKEKDKRLHNTKLLLQHYQEFKLYTAKTRTSTTRLTEEEKNILATITFDDEMVNSIKETTKRTMVMLQYVDRALDTLEFMYKQEKNEQNFNMLKKRYVEGKTISFLAEYYHLSERSVYRVIDSATERLSVLLFGIYGVDIDVKKMAT